MYTSGDRVSNMPFRSKEFLDFTRAWGIKATTSSPTFSQSNGQAERFVQTLKRMLTKAQADRQDPYLAHLDYRNSPISGLSYSPTQMLMSRRLRSKVPAAPQLLVPSVVDAHPSLRKRKQCQKQYYDVAPSLVVMERCFFQ